jgi:hypothetical protein
MTLKDYMRIRMGTLKINALTTSEAKIFEINIKVSGWYHNNKNMKITNEMLLQIKSNNNKNKYIKNIINHLSDKKSYLTENQILSNGIERVGVNYKPSEDNSIPF